MVQRCCMTENPSQGEPPADESSWGDTFFLGAVARRLLEIGACAETYNADGDATPAAGLMAVRIV